jgi:thiol-disulfide isomerase/thioredoxin
MPSLRCLAGAACVLFFCGISCTCPVAAGPCQVVNQDAKAPAPKSPPSKPSSAANQPSPDDELQAAITSAGTDRVALVRHLEEFLKKYPDSRNRPQIYRALVEACVQLRDNARAADYAERIIALNPNDMSTTVLAIQLLEKSGEEASLRRAVSYSTRVLEFVDRNSLNAKSPRQSQADWIAEKRRDRMAVLALRGRLELKLKDMDAAQKDFEDSYSILPNAAAAQQLGEIAELKKDLNQAVAQYAKAFALADPAGGPTGRREIRQKTGNAWRLAHGSEDGLGEYLLHIYDEVSATGGMARSVKNSEAHEAFDFTVRKAPDGSPYPLKEIKGKILVVDFWATWCGPCRELEPQFARVAAEFQSTPEVLFLAADCDDDETLVAPYLEEDKLRATVVFADGLDRLFAVNAYPTVIVIGRDGKTAFRSEGFSPDDFEQNLAEAIRRELARPAAPATAAGATP